MKKIFCLWAFASILSVSAKAQLNCGTDAVFNKLKAENPKISEIELSLNLAIKKAIEEKELELATGKTTATSFDIPLVIHLVHDYGSEYLTDDAIFEAVAFWDKVYNAENPDTSEVLARFKPNIGNARVRLHLATIDPSGQPTKGITRSYSYMTIRGSDGAKVDGWPNTKYVNIWLVNKFDADHLGAAAYAYYPSSGAGLPQYDGVIGLASYLNTDKTYPHELGHVFNLQHTWGNDNSPGVRCGDDLVTDTPPTMGHTSCTSADLYDATCSPGDINNTQNIMEYAYCSKMFTKGQVDRMQAALNSSVAGRNNLSSASNLAATGALAARRDVNAVADFTVERGVSATFIPTLEKSYFLCQNAATKFSFKNRSWNDTIVEANWSFSNSPSLSGSTALTANVYTTFSDPGWATVNLTVKGNNSAPQTISKAAVYVASSTAYSRGYAQYFTSLSDIANWPMFNYYNNNFKWEYLPSNGYPNSYGCIRYRSFDARTVEEKYFEGPDGDYDDIFTPAFDLNSMASSSSNLNLNFYTAGCITDKSNGLDSMQIFASKNCGTSWEKMTVLNFAQLMNNGVQNSEFAPTNVSQWRAQTINVPKEYRSDKTFFRFRYWAAYGGNNLYMDNFSISPWTTEIKEVAQNGTEVKIFPNPTSGNTKLCFTSGTNGEASYIIRDVTGKVIAQQNLKVQPNTFIQHEINRSEFPATGVYLITLTQSEQTSTQKLIVE